MDTWGFLAIVVGAVLYWGLKKKAWGLFVMGTGLEIVVGAVGAYLIVMSRLP